MTGCNITTDDIQMWLAPFTSGESHVLTVTLPQSTEITAIKVSFRIVCTFVAGSETKTEAVLYVTAKFYIRLGTCPNNSCRSF